MKKIIAASFIVLTFTVTGFSQVESVCLSEEEMKLYELISEYRAQKGLPKIPLSKSLCFVAQTHAKDSEKNYNSSNTCNLHSWSNSPKWSGCCYTSDHKRASCMWDKPGELTDYTGSGYEISHWNSSGATAESSLKGWKESSGHNAVILNLGTWNDLPWKAIGIGIRGGFAHVWFGQETDAAGSPNLCED